MLFEGNAYQDPGPLLSIDLTFSLFFLTFISLYS